MFQITNFLSEWSLLLHSNNNLYMMNAFNYVYYFLNNNLCILLHSNFVIVFWLSFTINCCCKTNLNSTSMWHLLGFPECLMHRLYIFHQRSFLHLRKYEYWSIDDKAYGRTSYLCLLSLCPYLILLETYK